MIENILEKFQQLFRYFQDQDRGWRREGNIFVRDNNYYIQDYYKDKEDNLGKNFKLNF